MQIWQQDSPGIADACTANDEFGYAIAAGDFNADGRADIAVGVPGESVGSASYAGAVNVIYGSSAGLTDAGDRIIDQSMWGGDLGSDNFGWTLHAFNFNSSGGDELAVSAPFETVNGVDFAGQVDVLTNLGGTPTLLDALTSDY